VLPVDVHAVFFASSSSQHRLLQDHADGASCTWAAVIATKRFVLPAGNGSHSHIRQHFQFEFFRCLDCDALSRAAKLAISSAAIPANLG
jgi:hypothetical protein